MRRIGSIIALCLLASSSAASQTFPDFVIRVNMAPETARGALVDSFLAVQASLPLIEKDTVVHFIYRGTGASVALAGDMNGWTPASFLSEASITR